MSVQKKTNETSDEKISLKDFIATLNNLKAVHPTAGEAAVRFIDPEQPFAETGFELGPYGNNPHVSGMSFHFNQLQEDDEELIPAAVYIPVDVFDPEDNPQDKGYAHYPMTLIELQTRMQALGDEDPRAFDAPVKYDCDSDDEVYFASPDRTLYQFDPATNIVNIPMISRANPYWS